MIKITHNMRCSKSRGALEILTESGINFQVVNYLNGELSENDLKGILEKLKISVEEITRKGEKLFKENFKENFSELSESQKIKILVENPILIERPIIWDGQKAVIGRPPKNINIFLK